VVMWVLVMLMVGNRWCYGFRQYGRVLDGVILSFDIVVGDSGW